MRPLPFWRQGTCAEDGGYPRENRSPQRRSPIQAGTAAAPSASLPPCPGSLSGIVPILYIKVGGSPLEACHPWAERSLGSLAIENVPKPAPVRRNGPTLGTPLWKSRPPNLHAPIGPFSGTNPDGMPGIQPMLRRSRPSSPDGYIPGPQRLVRHVKRRPFPDGYMPGNQPQISLSLSRGLPPAKGDIHASNETYIQQYEI